MDITASEAFGVMVLASVVGTLIAFGIIAVFISGLERKHDPSA